MLKALGLVHSTTGDLYLYLTESIHHQLSLLVGRHKSRWSSLYMRNTYMSQLHRKMLGGSRRVGFVWIGSG